MNLNLNMITRFQQKLSLPIIYRYLFSKIFSTVALVLVSMSGLIFVLGIADETSRRVKGDYTTYDAIVYKLQTLPLEVYEFVPLIFALAGLLSYATLSKTNEMVIFRQLAPNTRVLITRLILPALLIALVVMWVGEGVAPQLANNAKVNRALLRDRLVENTDVQWFKAGNWVIEANYINPETGEIIGAQLYRFDSNQLKQTVSAQRATPNGYNNGTATDLEVINQNSNLGSFSKTNSASSKSWTLKNAQVHSITETNIITEVTDFTFSPKSLNPNLLAKLSSQTDALNLGQLQQRVLYNREENIVNTALTLQWWQRILFPLHICLMLFIALGFSMESFRQRTIGDVAFRGLATALALGTILKLSAGLLSIAGLPSLLAASLPLVIALAIAVTVTLKKL